MKNFLIFIGSILFLGTSWYLMSPLFIDEIVNESSPIEVSIQDEVKVLENITTKDVKSMTEEEQKETVEQMKFVGEAMPDVIMKDEKPEIIKKPSLLYQGDFQDVDIVHKGSGDISLYTEDDKPALVRFENFTVTNGPGLGVFLTKTTDGTLGDGAFDLGKLKGNKGNQNYEIPTGVDLTQYKSVLIYCVPFKVPFAFAVFE